MVAIDKLLSFLFYYGGARFCSIRAVQGFVLFGQCTALRVRCDQLINSYYFCSIMVVQGFVLFGRCKVLFYSGGARFCSIRAVQGFVLFGRCSGAQL
jgi:archaeosine-15-forming tRNA-guanine transglycosylase